jgi:hypothetical protein
MVILSEEAVDSVSGTIEFEASMFILYAPQDYAVPNMDQPTSEVSELTTTANRRKRTYSSSRHGKEDRDGSLAGGILHIGSISQNCTVTAARIERPILISTSPVPSSPLSNTTPPPFVPLDTFRNNVSSDISVGGSVKLSTGDRALIRFRFAKVREYLTPGAKVLFRDNSRGTKMVGEIVSLKK